MKKEEFQSFAWFLFVYNRWLLRHITPWKNVWISFFPPWKVSLFFGLKRDQKH